MKPISLMLCYGLVAAFAAACQETSTQAPSAYRTAFAQTIAFPTCESQNITDPKSFVQTKVFFLSPSFDPTTTLNSPTPYRSPTGPSVYGTDPYSTDLMAAYAAAPRFFQEKLCGLNGIFIVQNACTSSGCTPTDVIRNSWGFRERPDQSAARGRYIATAATLWKWNGGNAAPPYDAYETAVLQQLLNWNGLQYQASTPDNSTMTILALLAHEFGHVYWYDKNNSQQQNTYDPNGFCPDINGFFKLAWNNKVNAPPPWRQFGEPQDEHLIGDAQIAALVVAVLRKDTPTSGRLLDRMYAPQGAWASLFAAFSPDEDFIETFKLYVLTSPDGQYRLTSLPIQIPNGRLRNIPADLVAGSKPVLTKKLNCIANSL